MTIHYEQGNVTLHLGDCIEVMASMPEASVDAIVCDPPYGLEFMGKGWDSFRVDDPGTKRNRGERAGVHGEATGGGDGNHPARGATAVAYGGGKRPETFRCTGCGKRDQFRNDHGCGGFRWAKELIDPYAAPPTMLAFQNWTRLWSAEAMRVLKPGGHLLAFGGSRTWHRLVSGLEDAGFEIRDTLMWLYGTGFPKSLNVGKAIDKAAGVEREVIGTKEVTRDFRKVGAGSVDVHGIDKLAPGVDSNATTVDITAPATDAARQWEGWGTALKPAYEPIVLARKPLIGTVAANVLEHGTGGLNIDATRIDTREKPQVQGAYSGDTTVNIVPSREGGRVYDQGRWPANVVLDEEAGALLDEQAGDLGVSSNSGTRTAKTLLGDGGLGPQVLDGGYGDRGGPSRFFYQAKASKKEREAGLDDMEIEEGKHDGVGALRDGDRGAGTKRRNDHPTVKPMKLMSWLVAMVTPPGGTVLDPFVGSGSTGMAAAVRGDHFIGIDMDAHYLDIAQRRIEHARSGRQS